MQMKNQKAITLIALIVTIIILLILAGIAISQIAGENGLFNTAKRARNNTLEAQELENITLAHYENKIDEIVDSSRDTVTITKEEYDMLKNTFNYSEEEKKIGTYNGKDLYQRFWSCNVLMPGAGTDATYIVDDLQVDTMVKCTAMFKAVGSPYYTNSDSMGGCYYGLASGTTPTFYFRQAMAEQANTNLCIGIIAQYTKTSE